MIPGFFTALSQDEIVRIDAASRRILEKTGVQVHHEEALNLLEDLGCTVDRKTQIVKIPPEIVQMAIDAAPASFSLFGRDPSFRIDLGKGVYFGPGAFAVFAEDLGTGIRRRALRQDLIDHLRVSEVLPGVEFNHVNVFPSDIPIKYSDLSIWADALIYQSKPIMNENYNRESVDTLVEMASLIRGSKEELRKKPLVCLDMCCVSPLTHDRRQVELLIAGTTHGLPISIESGPIGGGNSPVTLAAVTAQSNAEILSAMVISFAVKPGNPVLYGSWGRHLDMRYSTLTMGGPEFALQKTCTAQLARHYNLPSRGGAVYTDSMISDAQAGYEKMLTTLIPALSGISYISGMGVNETENCQSLAQLVIDDEIVTMVKRILRGVTVDTDHIAEELIMDRGPGSSFLDTDHTYSHFKEYFYPEISNRQTFEGWRDSGAPSVRRKAVDKALCILEKRPEHTLDKKLVEEIYSLVPKS
jgi:trimethylamine---corrinoid protein Co-methyltransferase